MSSNMTYALHPGSRDSRGRRERRKAETRARLLSAARRLFVQRGYDATRPQDVAEAADVAVGTFYAHFSDKRGAFLAFTEEAAAELMERIRTASSEAGSFEERLRRSLEALLAFAEEQPGILGAAFADAAVIAAGLPRAASLRERFARALAQTLRQESARGALHLVGDAEVVAHGIVGFVQGALAHGTTHGMDAAALAETVTSFVGAALTNAPEPARPGGARG
jgi:AcrR family transcriptional regulator